jgi:hypothetical protein
MWSILAVMAGSWNRESGMLVATVYGIHHHLFVKQCCVNGGCLGPLLWGIVNAVRTLNFRLH